MHPYFDGAWHVVEQGGVVADVESEAAAWRWIDRHDPVSIEDENRRRRHPFVAEVRLRGTMTATWLLPWLALALFLVLMASRQEKPVDRGRCLVHGTEEKMLSQNISPKAPVEMLQRVPVCLQWERP